MAVLCILKGYMFFVFFFAVYIEGVYVALLFSPYWGWNENSLNF